MHHLSSNCRYQGLKKHRLTEPKKSFMTDFAEEVGEQFEVNQPVIRRTPTVESLMVSGWVRAWHWYQLGQLSEVLSGCCEKELISRTIRPS